MLTRLGNVLYWIFNGAAVLTLLFCSYASLAGADRAKIALLALPVLPLWLIGRAIRYVFRGE